MNSIFLHIKFITTVSILLAACGGGQNSVIVTQNDETENHHTNEISYSTIASGIWPPQPVDITNAAPYVNDNPGSSIREIKHLNALSLAMQSSEVVAAIGNRYEVLASYNTGGKSDPLKTTEIEIYNYDNNHVVTVRVDRDTNTINIHSAAASDYQPAESEAETTRAISLARSHLATLGHNTDLLVGTALLAHPTATQLAANGKSFYEHRTLYVTFGQGSGTTPLFRATVDLSDEKVISGGPL